MTSTFLAEANKLKNIQNTLERNEQVLLEHIKKNGDNQIIEFREELLLSRKKDMENVWMEYKNIIGPLNKFKSLISKDPVAIVSDLNQIKKEMFTLEKNIKYSKARTKECLEKLCAEEKELVEEIKLYEQKMVHWGRHVNVTDRIYDKNGNKGVDKNVTDFLTFLSKHGGHTNGWDVEDHNLYLKAKSRCKTLSELCECIHALLPDISKEEIEAHDKWYINYLELKRKHKEAIKDWRKIKSAAHTINNNNNNNKVKINEAENRVKSAYAKEKYNREDLQKKLKQWRQEKEEKLETEQLIRNEMKKRQQEIEERRKEKQEEMKRAVQNWKMERLEKEQLKYLEKLEAERLQKEFKSAMANRLIKEFQSQDNLFVRKRKEQCQPKSKSFDKLPVCNINVPRDPKRLLKPTKQWIARLKADTDYFKKTDRTNNIKSVPKLAIPDWRKNLMV